MREYSASDMETATPVVPRVMKPTFVSPVVCDAILNRGQRLVSYKLFLVQAGGSAITLDYPDKDSAKDARAQLLQAGSALSVPSMRLFQAIVHSLTA